jgi:SAM-dependent MidA family methyltransferase
VNALTRVLVARIRQGGPLTVAEFMDAALYDPHHGYYSRASQRSGRAGDFFTSVDVGTLFGELIAVQLDEMWGVLREAGATDFDLVEAGAGNGRLARDVLDAAARFHPDLYARIRLTLVERSRAARDVQPSTLGSHVGRLHAVREDLPSSITGVIYANELLDALPVHVVTNTGGGLREIFVGERDGVLTECDGPVSSPAILEDLGQVEPGARVEVARAAREWIGGAAAALERGFVLLFDYGYDDSGGVSRRHHDGTLMAYRAHRANAWSWLDAPGETDLTALVDLAAVRRSAERAGLRTLGVIDQAYFLLALDLADRVKTGQDWDSFRQRVGARTLIMPGGLGSIMKTMVFAKGVGAAMLRGTASGRLT